jgi:hypothetical protein
VFSTSVLYSSVSDIDEKNLNIRSSIIVSLGFFILVRLYSALNLFHL